MVIQGTRFSGFYKRYETAREAAVGGAEIGADLIDERGELVIPGFVNLPSFCDCGIAEDPTDNLYGGVPSCLCDKLCDSTFTYPGPVLNWVNCTVADTTFDPETNPDMQFILAGVNTNYQVSVKIIDSFQGNSDVSGEQLGGGPVVTNTSTGGAILQTPYLYRVEIISRDIGTLEERARLSGLYAF
jgi:hypothetical protein